MPMLNILMFAALAGASPATGTPAYLACTLQDGDTATSVALTVDESGQSATIDQQTTGRVVRRRAIFSPTEVRIPDEPSTWVVDRVSLALQRIVTFSDKQFVDRGQCKVLSAPSKRAF